MGAVGAIAPPIFLDTSFLVGHLRRFLGFERVFAALAEERALAISAIVRFEVLQGMREHERPRTTLLLDGLATVPMDARVADMAGEFVRRFRRYGVTLQGPDAVIAATSVLHDAPLLTMNPRHFPMPDLEVITVREEMPVTVPPQERSPRAHRRGRL